MFLGGFRSSACQPNNCATVTATNYILTTSSQFERYENSPISHLSGPLHLPATVPPLPLACRICLISVYRMQLAASDEQSVRCSNALLLGKWNSKPAHYGCSERQRATDSATYIYTCHSRPPITPALWCQEKRETLSRPRRQKKTAAAAAAESGWATSEQD